jgi:hypothetical protein
MANIDFPTSPVSGDTYVFNNTTYRYNGYAWLIGARNVGGAFGCVIDNTPNTYTTGFKTSVVMPYDGTISSWTIIGDQTGSTSVDIWKTTYASYPSDVTTSITGGNYITLINQLKNTDSALTGWTKNFSNGDIYQFYVNSVSALDKITINILTNRTT